MGMYHRAVLTGLPLFCAGLLASLTGCQTRTPDHFSYTLADSGSSIAVQTGDTIDITLPRDLARDNIWKVKPIDGDVLLSKGSTIHQKPGATKQYIPADETFHFKAIGPGTSGLSLEYVKPLRPNDAPEKRFDVLVTSTGEQEAKNPLFDSGEPPEMETMTDQNGRVYLKPKGPLD